MQTKYNAYLTIYLSLIFGIVLSLLFVLIEGAAIGAVRAQAELVADLGLDSVFAEYNREILNQYELFFIDSSYGCENGGTGMVEKHLSDYMSYNMTPDKGLIIPFEYNLLMLQNPYLEISEVSFASDDQCMVWKAQAVNYMKAVYGGDLILIAQEHIDTVKSNGLTEKDAVGEISAQVQEFEEALSDKGIVEFGAESQEGYSYQKVSGMFDKIVGGGILTMSLPDGTSVSGAVMDAGPYFSARQKSGKINMGFGLHEGVDRPDGLVDELIYGEYLMKNYGSYMEPKDGGLLKYQIEYILCGFNSDAGNLRRTVELLFALRSAANLAHIYTDSEKQSEAELTAAVICTLLLAPEMIDSMTAVILGVWSFAETVSDIRQLLDGGSVPLVKGKDDWNTSLMEVFTGYQFGSSSKKTTGLSYQDYLRIFLGFMDKDTKAARSLDIVEMDIRQTAGNEYFRIDQCIDYMRVNFGFADADGHEFVFYKRMCYE
ncbi:MAG: hypothetical protein K2K74_09970 [Lachnospiraceae bacterium]|nr:hypothetical protein [Lachnospiraceae bacterium]